ARFDRGETEAAVPDRKRGHPVPACDRTIRIPVNLGVVMRVQVDVPWSNYLPRRIENFGAIACVEPANFGDFAVFDPDVGLIARDAGAVDNHAVFDNSVELSHNSHLLRSALAAEQGRPDACRD